MSRKQKNLILGLIFAFVLSLALLFSNNSSKLSDFENVNHSPTNIVSKEESKKEVFGDSIIGFDPDDDLGMSVSPGDEELAQEISQVSEKTYHVVKVVDGDTIDVNIDGKVERLRLIGIDTPETVDPRKPIQCFGREASNKAKELLMNQFVKLEIDDSQGEKDKYGRLLRYVFLPDGSNYNLFMIRNGYAHEYTYNHPYKYQSEFKQAEIDARASGQGFWSSETCSGNK